jgi:hypothetical protein
MTGPGVTDTNFINSDVSGRAEQMLADMEQASLAAEQQVQTVSEPPITQQAAPITPETGTQPQAVTQPPVVEQPQYQVIDPTQADIRVKIVVDGQEKLVNPKEYTEDVQRHDVWTQRMQAVAQQRQQLEQHYTQREAELIQAAQAIQLARQEMSQNNPYAQMIQQVQQQQAVTRNPNEIATLGEVQQQLVQMQQQFQQSLQQQGQQAQLEIQQRLNQERESYEQESRRQMFTQGMTQLMGGENGKFLLEVNPLSEAEVRFEVAKLSPRNPQEALQFAETYVAKRAEQLRGRLTSSSQTASQTLKQEAVKKAQVVMEAPGVGSAPPPGPQWKQPALKRDGSVDWDTLRARAEAMLE